MHRRWTRLFKATSEPYIRMMRSTYFCGPGVSRRCDISFTAFSVKWSHWLADARDTFCHSLLRRCQVQAPNVSTRLFCHCLQVGNGCSRNLWLKWDAGLRWAPVVALYESFCFPACPDFSPSINSAAEKVAYFYRRGGLKRTFQWQDSIQLHKSRSQSVCDENFFILFPPFGITITCTSALLIMYPTSICLLKAAPTSDRDSDMRTEPISPFLLPLSPLPNPHCTLPVPFVVVVMIWDM